MENNRIIKTKLFSGGKFELKFTTQEDYKKYTNKRLTLIILILSAQDSDDHIDLPIPSDHRLHG